MIRKLTKRKKTIRYDANAAEVMPIYQRATQSAGEGGLQSEPARVSKILAEAQERQGRKLHKSRVLKPTRFNATPATDDRQYRRLGSGQIVGHPIQMNEFKSQVRRNRLGRRAEFRAARINK